MKRKTCLLTIIIVFCVFSIAGLGFLSSITKRASDIFGPPSPNLGVIQTYLLSARIFQQADKLTVPKDIFGAARPFSIELGESPITIANRLESQEIITDAEVFQYFLIYSGLDTQIQAGEFTLSPATPAKEIAYQLLDSTPGEIPFAILPGWRLEEIAESLPNSGLNILPDHFLQEAHARNLEGYLLPGIYQISRTSSLSGLLDTITSASSQAITPEMQTGFSNQGLSLDQAIKLASIVEREAILPSEMPMIASVFLNRLGINMKLDADPTVQYAVGFNPELQTWWTNPLTLSDLQTDSPFNTYQYPGLPPSPVCSPSLDALRAVAFPAQTPYYYFRAACDNSGSHVFAATYDEHLNNACP